MPSLVRPVSPEAPATGDAPHRTATVETMRLDVLIPTHSRSAQLRRLLDSILAAEMPAGLDVSVTVLDNNSTDDTRAVTEAFMPRFGGRLQYLFEPRPGKSFALNTGIEHTTGELIGMLDDDEEVEAQWFVCVHDAFADPTLDFIGGPYLPKWGAPPPPWLPDRYRAVIGWIDGGDEVRAYGRDFDGMLMGGNAVIRRPVLERVGPYATWLSRSMDEEMFQRLMAAGARGLYLPTLRIRHYIPPERLTKRYYRRWAFRRGKHRGVMERREPWQGAHLAGIPRWKVRQGLEAGVRLVAQTVLRRRTPGERLTDELLLWDLAGFVYGRHLKRVEEPGPGNSGSGQRA